MELGDLSAMEEHLQSPDPTALLLRGHLWVERLLLDLIRSDLEFPEEFNELDRLAFPTKVSLARAQGSLPWPNALLELNRVRNRLAHDVRFEIDLETALSLRAAFEPDFGTIDAPGDYGEAPAIERLVTAADVTRAVIISLLNMLMNCTKSVVELRVPQLEVGNARLEKLVEDLNIAQDARETSPPPQ